MQSRVDTVCIPFPFFFFMKPVYYLTILFTNDNGAIIWMLIRMGKNCRCTAIVLMCLQEPGKIHIKHYIPVQQKEIPVQSVF